VRKLIAPLALVAGVAIPAIAADKPAGPPIPLFLTTPAAAGGFTDPNKERADTLKDLTEALGGKKNVRLVPKREEAKLVVEVTDRGVREDSGGFTKAFGGKNEVKRVHVKLTVGEYSTDIAGESAGGGFGGGPGRGAWKKAAYKVADQIEKWVEENRGQIEKATTAAVEAPAPKPDAPAAKQ